MSAADQGCALLAGGLECHCADDVAVHDDRVLADRATDKFIWQQRAGAEGRVAVKAADGAGGV